MARIRTIKPEFWTDEKVVECSPSARLLFVGTWNFADDYGNLQLSAKQIKAKILPCDNVKIETLLQELIDSRLLIEYSTSRGKFLHINNFTKHQKIDKPSSPQCPPFPFDEDSETTPLPLVEGSPLEGKGREGKGEEGSKSVPAAPPSPTVPRFIKPPIPEIMAYCEERDNRVDPQKFYDHYESNGWKVGRNPMKDWRAAVRTWERSGYETGLPGDGAGVVEQAEKIRQKYGVMK